MESGGLGRGGRIAWGSSGLLTVAKSTLLWYSSGHLGCARELTDRYVDFRSWTFPQYSITFDIEICEGDLITSSVIF